MITYVWKGPLSAVFWLLHVFSRDKTHIFSVRFDGFVRVKQDSFEKYFEKHGYDSNQWEQFEEQ